MRPLISTILFFLFLLSLLSFPPLASPFMNPQSILPFRPLAIRAAPSNISTSTSSSTHSTQSTSPSVTPPSTPSSSTPTPTTKQPTSSPTPPPPTTSSAPSVTSTTPPSSTPTTSTTSTSTTSVAPASSIISSASSSVTLITSGTSSTPIFPTFIPSPTVYPTTVVSLPQTSTTSIAAAQASASVSPKGFFANSGAVAGTFTVVGLVAVGLLAMLFLCIRKKRRAAYDDDDTFFEKIHAPTSYSGGGGHRGLGTLSPILPPATDAYADDAYTHASHAQTSTAHQGEYNQEPQQYGMEYPPDAIYTTQQLQQQQLQQSAVNTAWAYSPASSSSHHPYVNPFNSPNPRGVPPPPAMPVTESRAPVNARASSIAYGIPQDSQDSFYGGRN